MSEPLPPLWIAELDGRGLAELAIDLAHAAEVLAVRRKASAEEHAAAPDAAIDVEAAVAALTAGRVRAIQVVYRHRGDTWCDTVTRCAPAGYRLVRRLQ